MGESVRVVTPWRPDNGLRSALWDFCRNWWESQGVAPIEAPSPEGPFNRSAAINAGLAGDWDLAIVIDADVAGPDALSSCDLTTRSGRLVFPFDRYVGLAPWGTRAVLRGEPMETAGALRVVTNHESSVLVIPRAVWDATGGFDERFVGWGQDDVAFCQAARVLTGEPLRLPGTVYHLWHETAPEKWPGDPLWEANQALGRAYRDATTREAMEELVWSRSAPPSLPISTRETLGTAYRA